MDRLKMLPEHMRKVLFSVKSILDQNRIKYSIIGGIAVGYHAAPRTTEDIDILVNKSSLPKLQQLFGTGRVMDNGYAFTINDVDVEFLFSYDGYEDFLFQENKDVGFNIPNAYQMLYLKLKANRSKDAADIIQIVSGMSEEEVNGFQSFVKKHGLSMDLLEDFNSLVEISRLEKAQKKATLPFAKYMLRKYAKIKI